MIKIIYLLIILINAPAIGKGYDVYGIGLYDIEKWITSGTQDDEAISFKFERRYDKSIYKIGPESEKFFNLKPLIGFEGSSDSAIHILTGVYLEDNLGELFINKNSNYIFIPSLSIGYYHKGTGKNLGHDIQFRTSLEISYKLVSKNRVAVSYSHTSNANIGDKKPGVEILTLSYQIPFN